MRPARDAELVQIVDRALADAAARAQKADGSSSLACQPGCTPCCHGVFRISALDAARLRDSLQALEETDAPRAAAIRLRAQGLADALRPVYPGDPGTGILSPEDEAWEVFADLPEADAPCPALDPVSGRCDLYTGRPLTCRLFGPPVQNETGIGICELCYVGASEGEILAGEMPRGRCSEPRTRKIIERNVHTRYAISMRAASPPRSFCPPQHGLCAAALGTRPPP